MEQTAKLPWYKPDTSRASIIGGLVGIFTLVLIKALGGGAVPGALAGLAVYGSFYSSGWRRVLCVILALCLIALALFLRVADESGSQIDNDALINGEVQATFIRGATESCFDTQRDHPENAGIPEGTLNQYCSCSANRLAGLLTYGEVNDMEKTGTIPAAVQIKMDETSKLCLGEVGLLE